MVCYVDFPVIALYVCMYLSIYLGFMQQFITPIVKCSKGKKEVTFFTIPEYNDWKEGNNEAKGWRVSVLLQ